MAAPSSSRDVARADSLEGLVVTRYGHGVPCERIEVVEAAHPVPDARRPRGGRAHPRAGRGLAADDLLICLISGGGSALLALPAPGVTLDDKQAREPAPPALRRDHRRDQLRAQAPLGSIKGGRLAVAAHPARVVTYLISDVPGDDPSAIVASGPTVPDPTTFAEALAVLERYGIDGPAPVLDHLRAAAASAAATRPETAGSRTTPASSGTRSSCSRRPRRARAARPRARRRRHARAPRATTWKARRATSAALHAALALGCTAAASDASRPPRGGRRAGAARPRGRSSPCRRARCVLLSGGETTVTVRGSGRGGRNAEYLLGAGARARRPRRLSGALAADTDGIDGTEDNAGALVTPGHARAGAGPAGVDPRAALAANDAYGAFAALGDLLVTGPTPHQRQRSSRHPGPSPRS